MMTRPLPTSTAADVAATRALRGRVELTGDSLLRTARYRAYGSPLAYDTILTVLARTDLSNSMKQVAIGTSYCTGQITEAEMDDLLAEWTGQTA